MANPTADVPVVSCIGGIITYTIENLLLESGNLKRSMCHEIKVKYMRKKIRQAKSEEKQLKLELQRNILFLKIVKYCLRTGETDLLEELR
ncbi:hypothetical protein ES707_21464 [subsurface metagenome]